MADTFNDFTSNQQPFETPAGAAGDVYAQTEPTLGRALGAMFHESSIAEQLGRLSEQGKFAGSNWFAQAMTSFGQSDPSGLYLGETGGEPLPGSVQTPMLSAEEANKRYAPIGPDGKQTTITAEPMPEGVASLVGKAKAQEIERQSVIARYSNAVGPLVSFATGAPAFMLDPLNASTAFLPGIGEEAIAARLGGGLVATTAARIAAGAATGAVAQAPLSAARYGLGTLEAADYSLRDAFRDTMFGAAAGAIVHAGFGTIGDLLRRGEMAGADPSTRDAATVLGANATTTADAMKAAVSQISDGREVDVGPTLNVRKPPDIIDFLIRRGGIQDENGELSAMDLNRANRGRFGNLTNNRTGLSLDYAREAAEEAGFLRHDSDVNDLIDAITETQAGNPRYRPEDIDWLHEYQEARMREEAAADPWHPLNLFKDVAEAQSALYRDGYAPGMTSHELEVIDHDIFGPEVQPEGGVELPPLATASPEVTGAAAPPPVTITEAPPLAHDIAADVSRQSQAEAKPLSPEEQEIAALESQREASKHILPAEERAQLDATASALDNAGKRSDGYRAAAQCLTAAGGA